MKPGGADETCDNSPPSAIKSTKVSAIFIGDMRVDRARRRGRLVAKSPWSGLAGCSIMGSGIDDKGNAPLSLASFNAFVIFSTMISLIRGDILSG